MNTLVLRPTLRALRYVYFQDGRRLACSSGREPDYRGPDSDGDAVVQTLRRIRAACVPPVHGGEVDAVAILVPFGGAVFRGPALVCPEVLAKVEGLVPRAPLHLPVVLALARACGDAFPDVPVVLVFQTAFFANLPARESFYGLDFELMHKLGVRRCGFHGLYHQAAVNHVTRRWRLMGIASSARIISICMEPRPELAAIAGGRPLMVTGGTTPLEGLPGQTTSGELDPGIVLLMGQEMKWGPEQIDRVLTRESGLRGLIGRPTTWESLFASEEEDHQLPRQIFEYRLLQACGAAMASMGGADTIVFSGRSAAVGQSLGPRLISRLALAARPGGDEIAWEVLPASLDGIVADIASAAVLEQGRRATDATRRASVQHGCSVR